MEEVVEVEEEVEEEVRGRSILTRLIIGDWPVMNEQRGQIDQSCPIC